MSAGSFRSRHPDALGACWPDRSANQSGQDSAYFDTLDLVAESGAQYPAGEQKDHHRLEVQAGPVLLHTRSGETVTGYAAPAAPAPGEPFSVQFVPGGVRINGDIRDQETLTELVNALQALRGFLRKTKAQDAQPVTANIEDEDI